MDPTAAKPSFIRLGGMAIKGPSIIASFIVREELVLIALCQTDHDPEIKHPCIIWNYAEGWYILGPGVGPNGVHEVCFHLFFCRSR